MSKSVLCIVRSDVQAERIAGALTTAGFRSDDISVLFADQDGGREFAHDQHTMTPEGAATGAGAGGVIGGALGWLVGIGSLAIAGVGAFIAAGPILAALGGAAIGATAGGLAGSLIGMGIPEDDAKQYEDRIRGGSLLISVHIDDSTRVDHVKEIFKQQEAEYISYTRETPPRPAAA